MRKDIWSLILSLPIVIISLLLIYYLYRCGPAPGVNPGVIFAWAILLLMFGWGAVITFGLLITGLIYDIIGLKKGLKNSPYAVFGIISNIAGIIIGVGFLYYALWIKK